jgi:uncharacterized protein (TIGR00375 family)
MIKQIIDLHIHSKYSRACSPDLELPKIAFACQQKGIDIVATGDFTHPAWFAHIKEVLEETNEGIYVLNSQFLISNFQTISNFQFPKQKIKFILSTEISCIYKHKDKCRRLHLLILAPSIECVEKFNNELEKRGVNLKSDGRPIMGLPAKEVLKIMMEVDERMMMIPAHAWTPWFAVFGSKSGYDSLKDCFEEFATKIKAIETGLSSDPTMNHRLSALDNITLVSNSDAHSLDKLGREANVLQFDSEKDITYAEIKRIIETGDRKKFLYTIEFYPEEGMYHFDGHRSCNVCFSPKQTKKEKFICPKCKKKLTVGVLHRVADLADREEKNIPTEKFISHKYIVPLREIIGKVFEVGSKSKKVAREYDNLIKNLGNEFKILLDENISEIEKFVSDKNIAISIRNMRAGIIEVNPGYDGVYGTVEVLAKKDRSMKSRQHSLL